MNKFYKIVFVVVFILLMFTSIVYAHGVEYEFIQNNVMIKAWFSGGKPFYPATFDLYSPDNYEKVYLSGETDNKGIFSFKPDKPGKWIVMLRDKTGHGTRINLDVNENLSLDKDNPIGSINLYQKLIMVVCVIWGFIGTALFFIGRKKKEV
jgi:nickel transport protein